MSIQPEGEDLRKAVKWISDQRREEPGAPLKKWIEDAALRFNLSPLDVEFLGRQFEDPGD